MLNLARRMDDPAPANTPEMGTATVVASGGALRLNLGHGPVPARRAASCLLAPEPGDRVLVAHADGACWVLAILERADAEKARLDFDGDVTVRVRDGRFAVAASDGVDLVTGKDVTVASGGLSVTAEEGSVFVRRLSFLGEKVLAEVDRLKTVAGFVDQVMERLSQKMKRSYRRVEEVDHTRAGQIDYAAQGNARLHGRHALVTANQLVKVDGEQIHVG